MKPSDWLYGRAKAFRLDQDHLSRQIDSYNGESEHALADMKDRRRGYGIAAVELDILADEMEREGK